MIVFDNFRQFLSQFLQFIHVPGGDRIFPSIPERRAPLTCQFREPAKVIAELKDRAVVLLSQGDNLPDDRDAMLDIRHDSRTALRLVRTGS